MQDVDKAGPTANENIKDRPSMATQGERGRHFCLHQPAVWPRERICLVRQRIPDENIVKDGT